MSASDSKPVLLLIPSMLNTTRVFDRASAGFERDAEVKVLDIGSQSDLTIRASDGWAAVADVAQNRRRCCWAIRWTLMSRCRCWIRQRVRCTSGAGDQLSSRRRTSTTTAW